MGLYTGLRDAYLSVVQLARARLSVGGCEQAGAHQEVRPPQQRRPSVRARAQQHALVDDVGSATDGHPRRPSRLRVGVRALAYLRDGTAVRPERMARYAHGGARMPTVAGRSRSRDG